MGRQANIRKTIRFDPGRIVCKIGNEVMPGWRIMIANLRTDDLRIGGRD